MIPEISDEEFERLIGEAVAAVPQPYNEKMQNIAFLVQDEPDEQQRQKLKLNPGTTLFGLYEGVPLPQRGGATKLLPDKITLFKKPLLAASTDLTSLRRNIGHTIWHEVAHYYGLDHDRIDELDSRPPRPGSHKR